MTSPPVSSAPNVSGHFAPDSTLVHDVVAAINVEPRRGIETPTMLVQHYTGMPTAKKAIDWLACAESRVSCHYVIDEVGRITQLVPERLRAWHAGVSSWHGETDLNSASVGIEIQNPGHEDGYWDFPDAQIAAVIALSRDVIRRHGIRPERVVAHSDIAPLRKIDPGEKFPWSRLAAAGIGHWVAPSPVRDSDAGFGLNAEGAGIYEAQTLLALYGYDVPRNGVYDKITAAAVTAFQRHFRPARCDGRFDLSTLATLERLLAALPIALVA